MTSFSQIVSRIHRGWMLMVGNSIPIRGRLDVFKILRVRRKKLSRSHAIRLSQGKVFVDGQNAIIDLRVFAQIFVDQVYRNLDLTDRIVIDIGAHKEYFGIVLMRVPSILAAMRRFSILHRGLHKIARATGIGDQTEEGFAEFLDDLCPCGLKRHRKAIRKALRRSQRIRPKS